MNSTRNHKSLYVSVLLPVPVDSAFTYQVPDELAASAEVGRRVLVPFGKRLLTGFIATVTDNPGELTPDRIKPIQDVLDDEPVIDSHMFDFAGWMAEYYLTEAGEVLKSAVSSGTMVKSRLRIYLNDPGAKTPPASLTGKQRTIVNLLERDGHMLVKNLERTLDEPVMSILRGLEKKGIVRIEREIASPRVRPKTERYVRPLPTAGTTPGRRSAKQTLCLEILRAHPEGLPLAELLERFSLSRGVVNAVVNAGLAVYDEVEISRRSAVLDQDRINADHPLTGEQKECVRIITEEAHAEKPRPILLWGVTGSGKTRVYIELVRDQLSAGCGAVILVPEIALTPQTARFFTSVFPEQVAILHSAMSPGERFDMWRSVLDGTCRVVIGPRSALFAPVRNPGIIIVDEEHDTSYKQTDTSPRYNARDMAVLRGNMLGIPVVLGSATPSMESWFNVLKGKYLKAVLTERINSKPLPDILTVDMKEERAAGNFSSISRLLRARITDTIGQGEKCIILINRRGFATSIHCRECGYILTCPECAVGLTYHSSKGLAVCHWCGHEQHVLEHCPECGSTKLAYRGMGTQRIEKELAEIAGPRGIVRMDSDTTRIHDGHFKLLEEFRKGAAPILLGTQMVAKGLDIPEVTLVGIISADLALFLPDFRAFERTFQLITQVAGRAGRGERPGTVILQTFNPDNYAIQAASNQDFESFADVELKAREELNFPPFSRLVLIELASTDKASLDGLARDIAAYLAEHASGSTEILGPAEAPIARRKGKHRMHILLKSQNPKHIQILVRPVLEKVRTGKATITIDVDPVDLM